jgi:phage terminase small subunit
MVKGLTGKQQKFCECIVKGMTGIDSYMTAYNSNNKNVANVESTKLLKRDDITAYIKELYKPIKNHNENMLINERQQQIDFIKSRIQECIKKDDEQSLIRWNEQLNKIYALYKEAEQEQKTDNKVNNLDTSTLIKLADIG